ncbi:MAG: RNA polymerase sigma factor [Candidatus Aminicenantales bacterium]
MKSEDELVEEVLSGRKTSFEVLLRPYRNILLTTAYRMTGNLEEAKEISQETLFKAFRRLRSYRQGTSFKNWLLRIVINTCYDFLRKRARVEAGIRNHERWLSTTDNENPERIFSQKEIRERIIHSLQSLSPRERAVFLLRDAEGLSIKEASSLLGCSSGSVRTHLSRARQKIREKLENVYFLKKNRVK